MTASMCEYVEGSFEEVTRILGAHAPILRTAAVAAGGEETQCRVGDCELVHQRMASVDVHFGGVDASLRLFPVVGEVERPMTELVVVARSSGNGGARPSDAARRFLDTATRLLEEKLRARHAA